MDKKIKPQNQGEGDRESARRYNQNAEQFKKSGQVDEAAEQAKKAVEGPGGAELREAEEQGKKRIAEEDPLLRRQDDGTDKI
jgi:hypothetical protein